MTDEPNELTIFESGEVSPEYLKAVQILKDGKPPEKAIKEHPGKDGKVFRYLSHVWVTRQLRNAMGPLWDFEVLGTTVYPDHSATAIVKLTIKMPLKDGSFIESTITEVGAWTDPTNSKTMSSANLVASAVSRGLCRAVMRRFGLGEEFYEADDQMTARDSWNALLKYAETNGLSEDEVKGILREADITGANLMENWSKAFKLVRNTVKSMQQREIPEDL